MFFAFYILVLINYVADSSSFVLKRVSQGVTRTINHNDHRVILPDVRNKPLYVTMQKTLFEIAENHTNLRSPNLKVNAYDKKLSDEILSIKQNLYGREILNSTNYKSPRNQIATTTSEIKQKWPVVELLSQRNNLKEHQLNVEDSDFRYLFPKYNQPSDTEASINFENNEAGVYNNQSKQKVVDLRSLTDSVPSDISGQHKGFTHNHDCSCTRSTKNLNSHLGDCSCKTGVTPPQNCADCSRTSVSYTVMPFYLTYEPYIYYPPQILHNMQYDNKQPSGKSRGRGKDDYTDTFEEDMRERDVASDSSEESYEYYVEPKKEKHRSSKEGKHDRKSKLHWNTELVESRPQNLVRDLIEDLTILHPDSGVKKCHCKSSSNHSGTTRLRIVLLLIFIWYCY